ncbi:flagellar hook-basal body complex protein FliE [Shewanella surugensis]|uniref:Flagellar hook-basal body complex protein FliE n=1 Tax=Shewanella surugensis TaxID=212020 RepID=A0ABT0LAH2_9GAMM|nr:flagellar hook-basal body complex protein FliE [Shewanella surugensis]MCL1124362.1 flagellar hook-basal body complex protein FliE [Shewanella surugensis]
MQLSSNPLLQEMQAINEQLETKNRTNEMEKGSIMPAISQQVQNTAGSDFGDLLSQAIGNVNSLQSNAGQMSQKLDMGDSSVTLSDTVIAREKASVVFEATVQVRNKLVDAYKEIMSMPV